jgi:hypothetical protein
MPFRRTVAPLELQQTAKLCRHPEHNPPGNIVLRPGHYVWECPECGLEISFVVKGDVLNTGAPVEDFWWWV